MMVMQGFFDDSGSSQHQKTYVLAGFVSWSNNWADFSDKWDEELRANPAIEYFKWHEAVVLKGQFAGWDAHQAHQKKLRLADIARTYSMLRVRIIVEWAEFQQYRIEAMRHWPKKERLPPILDNPYFLLFYNTVMCVAQFRLRYKWDVGFDYIFDIQGRFGDDATKYWDAAVEIMPEALRPYAGERPIHRSDKAFQPLQAADMYAGACRAALLKPHEPVDDVLAILGQVPATERSLDLGLLADSVDQLARDPLLRVQIRSLSL